MCEDSVFSRSYFVRLADVTNDREGFLICEVERSKLELKRFKVWSYCGYPNEIEDVSESIKRQDMPRTEAAFNAVDVR